MLWWPWVVSFGESPITRPQAVATIQRHMRQLLLDSRVQLADYYPQSQLEVGLIVLTMHLIVLQVGSVISLL